MVGLVTPGGETKIMETDDQLCFCSTMYTFVTTFKAHHSIAIIMSLLLKKGSYFFLLKVKGNII